MRPQIVKIFIFVLCLCACTPSFAKSQQVSNGPPPPGSQRTVGPELPIDEHLFILIAIAVVLGIYVAYRRHVASRDAQ